MTFVTDQPPFRFRQGTRPLLISMPHVGTHVPPALAVRLTEEARHVPDTDWHLERLYDFANRAPDGASLYPGQSVTGLCPIDTFDDTPIYTAGDVPDAAEIAARRDAVWHPYHRQLQAELARMKAAHTTVVLWDAHSIRSRLPRFFAGKLPDLNLGTANGASCSEALASTLLAIAQSAPSYAGVLNGRFKGGYITREYGDAAAGVHAVQLEMTQSSYMQEALPFNYLPEAAAGVLPQVRQMLNAALEFAQKR
jgi:N-formylglutamate deformylase